MKPLFGSDPILDCPAAGAFEVEFFAGDQTREWTAMRQAGYGVGNELLKDIAIAGLDHRQPVRVLVLVGKGHNGGDAMLAATRLLEGTTWSIDVGFVFGQDSLRPLAQAAWRELQQHPGSARVESVRLATTRSREYAVILDGVFGFQFRPPLNEAVTTWLAAGEKQGPPRLRAAVDLPSGLGETGAFAADFTYATGILKTPLLELPNAGRMRYIDIGFFEDSMPGENRVVTNAVLDPLRRLRPAISDKRTFGQLAVVGGSRSYPGAVALAVAAALHSGVGNVTAFGPASIAAPLAARWPEAMWMPCPETEDGGLAIDAGDVIRRHLSRATALLVGPGLGREPETHALIAAMLEQFSMPTVLDADALQVELVNRLPPAAVLTPHAGEWQRIKDCDTSAVVVRKGATTTVESAGRRYHVVESGPELARGGSGDMLAGLIGGRLAAQPEEPLTAALQGTYWHARAASRMARRWGETALRATSLLAELNGALRP